MESSTLRTPKTGRSRFSKALPAPPPSFTEPNSQTSLPSLPSLPLQLPPLSLGLSYARTESPRPSPKPVEKEKLLPPIQAGPPLPPPKQLAKEASAMAAVSRPLDSPLPPLPKAPPPMSIPRRPVASPKSAVLPTPAPVSPTLSPSPVGSLSSLLSAYTNHSSESTPRSSTNSSNDLGSAKVLSSTLSPGEKPKDAQHIETVSSRIPVPEAQGLPPPPPLKDVPRSNTPPVVPKPQTHQASQSPTATQPAPSLANSSPPQDQLWRRRSQRSEKNLAVPELKLVVSHGSTAASSQTSSQVAQGDANPQSLPAAPQSTVEASSPAAGSRIPLPRSANASLPGRNIRPVASRQQIVAQETMGQKSSNLAQDRQDSDVAKPVEPTAPRPVPAVSPMKSMPNMASPVVRLPTPDYESSDIKHPMVETIVSPVSPASSPELPSDATSSSSKGATDAESQLRQAKSSPALIPKPAFAGRPPVGLPASPAANRKRTPNQSQFPARTSSRVGEQYRPTAVSPRRDLAGPGVLPVPKQRDAQTQQAADAVRTVSENGSTASDETVKPRIAGIDAVSRSIDSVNNMPESNGLEAEESDHTDHPGAALFPRNWYKPLPADEILDARPLEDKHFRCLTRHRYMTAARQRVNPIACRTCGYKDRVAECYICSACHLNICGGCNTQLRRCKGDLDQLLTQLKEKDSSVPEIAENTPRPDSETFAIPSSEPPLSFVIEAAP
ncbi:hypothetical protein QBC47DRAFT_74889 [Echria macrotheca]|uniref:Uncharacterized protein n=1 Tax=Echria macrotheca TaxID=438768 RepID=A0AAJ0F1Y1_9PEZI|nr:hypothetical protein QBC47DRAFT_74889 [Echria macrotheca]